MAKQRIPNGKYTKEFREEAVKLITDVGLSIPEVGRRLSLAPSTITYWVKAHKAGKLTEVGKMQRPLSEVEMENYRLKRELSEMRMERDILNKEFKAKAPNQVWVTDISYVPTEEGWLYIAGHKDIFHGEIVGYAMAGRMTKNLVSESLFRAVAGKRPDKGLVHHSDRGSQYCANDYRAMLEQFGMKTSMSRKGNCYDNASMESFWGTLKNELLHHRKYRTRQEAIMEITEYIEVFYNRQRRQARLGYLSPAAFEQQYHRKQKAA